MSSDFRNYIGLSERLVHSAKGSEWKDHKYIKRIDGTYYYPDNYEGGRHLSDLEDSSNSDKSKENSYELTKDDIESLAMEVIRGNFGNGQVRKDLLGEYYSQIQSRVNEILRGSSSNTSISEVKEEAVEKLEEAVEKAAQTSKGIDLDTVYSVYNKRK